ncbi:MAG: phosphoribosyltransferase [Proteobacteria bacterium]|nr:phosphoribosyltransferase [Pseudomonadota bacterium]
MPEETSVSNAEYQSRHGGGEESVVLPFADRRAAGRLLARALASFADDPEVVVLALPRGGVPVGFEVARALHMPLDVCVVRKLGLPGHVELAMGAVASGGVRVLNEEVVVGYGVPSEAIERATVDETRELRRRESLYRGGRPPLDVRGRTVLVVDDGLATGTSMRTACLALRALHPRTLVVAVPVGAPETCEALLQVADHVVCLARPRFFFAVSEWYRTFEQTGDAEVQALLEQAEREGKRPAPLDAGKESTCEERV